MQNDGYSGFIADNDLKLRGAAKARADGGQDMFRIVDGKVEEKAFSTVGFDDVEMTAPAGIAADGRTLYWTDSRNRNTAALVAQDLVTGATKVVANDPRVDIGGLLVHPRTREVQAYTANYLTPEWRPVDRSLAADLTFLQRELGGYPQIGSRSDDDRLWTVSVDPVTGPSPTYLFDRRAKKLTKLFVNRPELEGKPLVKMWPVEIKSRDGLTLPSYLTLPRSADPDGDGRANRKVPLVLSVHGGPNARDFHGFNSTHQWLANRGYAVLSVNYRASTGFGKNFINAGNLQWGRKMHDDLIDSVNWAVAQNVTTPDKVAIMGGSYGGYATLAGLTFTPDTFACGVAAVPPVNLVTLLETIPPYWEAGRQQMYRRLGNLSTAEGRALLKERSPLTYVDRIKKPLLIAQGANDPRVKQAEPDQIVAAMKAKNIPVTYLLFPDEGHGFARPVNNIAYRAVAENFLARCLGGRAEPIGNTLATSTAKVPHGAEFAPGLKDALAMK
jgi:dipeptidyl aminopeptidase/acylaminoacyl peptidase